MVVAPENRGWILDGICQEVGQHFPGQWLLHYGIEELPPARAYFFSHYSLFASARRHGAVPPDARTLVFFTHPPDLRPLSRLRFTRELNRCSKVLSMCTLHADSLLRWGLDRDRVEVALPGADPGMFLPHRRGSGAVGLCSAYYSRKSPDCILRVVERMPHREFLLVGRGWEQAPEYDRLKRLQNLTYVQPSYADYPGYYAQMDVLLSPSQLEGGPIPLLEAMMSNVVPVATRTGWAQDLVTHGENGFLYDYAEGADAAVGLIEEAFGLAGEIRPTVEHLTWDRFSRQVQGSI